MEFEKKAAARTRLDEEREKKKKAHPLALALSLALLARLARLGFKLGATLPFDGGPLLLVTAAARTTLLSNCRLIRVVSLLRGRRERCEPWRGRI